MKKNNSSFCYLSLLNYLVLFCLLTSIPLFSQTEIIRTFSNFTFPNPIDIQYPNDNSNRLFVVSQQGIISGIPKRVMMHHHKGKISII